MKKIAVGILLTLASAPFAALAQVENGQGTVTAEKAVTEKMGAAEAVTEEAAAAEAATDSLPTYEMLDDVVIEAVRPLIKSDGATTTYSVEEDTSAKGQALIDVLRRVPGLTVDGEGNVKLQGKSDFKIMVNGREEPMFSQNAKEIFKAMPASAVSKIEVITEPGAKYDAEGTAGILNLVTEHSRKADGYNGSLSAAASSSDYNASGFIIGKINKVTAQVNLTYSGNDGLERTMRDERVTDYLKTGEQMTENSKRKQRFNFMQGGYKLSWEPNERNLVTSSFNFTHVNAGLVNSFQKNSLRSAEGVLLWETGQMINAGVHNTSFDFDLSYQHSFDDLGHLIVASYAFNFGDNTLDYKRDYEYQDRVSQPWRRKALNNNLSRQHTVQVDYTNPFRSEHHKLEAGLKGIFRHNSAWSYEKVAETLNSGWFDDPSQSTDLMQFQDILAAYGSYSYTSDKWNARAGVRYEHTRMGIHFHDGTQPNFQKHLDDVVPNASVTYNLAPARNVRLAYSMRISRPTIEQVNPFEQTLGYNGQRGNPDLTSERLNTVSLTYTSFGRLFGGSIGVDFTDDANAIEQVTIVDGLQTTATYNNSGTRRTVGFRGFLNYNIIRNMTLSLNGDLEWKNMKAPAMGYHNSGWGGNIGANWSWRLDDIATFGAFGGWGSRNLSLEGYWGSWNYFGASVSRDFLKDKSLNIGLNAMNFIKPVHTFKSFTETDDIRMMAKYRSNNWRVGVSLTWRFGTTQQQVKSTVANLDSDDQSSGSGNNRGQGNGIGL